MSSDQDLPWPPLSRRTLVKTLGLAGLACSPIFQAGNLLSGETPFPERKMEINKAGDDSGLTRASRPPIDLAAPGRAETATFALG